MSSKKLVFITGATGVMGLAGLKELMARRDRIDIRLLVRPSAANRKFAQRLENEPGIEIVWGDLTNYDDVLRGVAGTPTVPAAPTAAGTQTTPDAPTVPNAPTAPGTQTTPDAPTVPNTPTAAGTQNTPAVPATAGAHNVPTTQNSTDSQDVTRASNIPIVPTPTDTRNTPATTCKPADYVLHVGGMVSPAADRLPKTTRKVNVTAAENIAKAVLSQPNSDQIKVVYIGSVAQTSDRNPPLHWGRTGDPITISVYDHYAISKTIAERTIVDSGIKNWLCLRQSGILHPGVLNNFDPIMFHVPLRGVLEWSTVEDSGRLLANICEESVPDELWGRFFNIGSGREYRITNYEFMRRLLDAIWCPPPEKIFEARWFALRNFHGQWYLDSDELERLVPFRENLPLDEYFRKRMRARVPSWFRLARLAPAWLIKLVMRSLAHRKGQGTMDWIRSRDQTRIASYFGSYEAWAAIPDWPHQNLTPPSNIPPDDRGEENDHGAGDAGIGGAGSGSSPSASTSHGAGGGTIKSAGDTPIRIDHGYDRSKPAAELDLEDMRQAARFRGGKCLSTCMIPGDMATRLEWECQFGHRFSASPALVLGGGHWCPECLPPPWNYDAIAAGNPFFAQVWHPLHGRDERNFFDESIYADWQPNSP